MYQYKAKDSEIKPYPLFLGIISKDFTINIQKIGLKGNIQLFSVDCNPILILAIFQMSINFEWKKCNTI